MDLAKDGFSATISTVIGAFDIMDVNGARSRQ